MKLLLKAVELPYRGVNRLRRALYRAGVLQPKRLHKPVLSIGNLAAGGTGKTPAVIAAVKELQRRGLRVAVLTRGYGRANDVQELVTSFDAVKYGDEPVLIYRATSADVIVGSNRYENAREHDADVFVLDDGFQHLQLHRDVDVVIDAPSRFFREGRSALRDADFVIPRRLRVAVPESLRVRRVFAFAGLADNEQFFDSLRAAGLEVIGARGFRDHHRYTPADLEALRREANGATLVTTEKDAVKLGDANVVAVAAEFLFDEQVLREIAERLLQSAPEQRRRKRRKNPLLQRVEYIAYRFVAQRVSGASEESLHRWGTRLGAVAGALLRRRDQLAMRNLAMVFPERGRRELRAIADAAWRHFGREALLTLQAQHLSLEELTERCPFVGEEMLTESIARGKGTLLLTAHWGGWEIAGLALMSRVHNVLTVARPLDNELLERDLQRMRARTGAAMIDRRHAARSLLKGLAGNAVVVLLPDQAVLPREGVLVPFLGHPAWTTPAPAKMAIRAGATIVFAFCIPDGLRHRVEFETAIPAGEESDPVALTARINDIFARRIRERPELWLWMHDRWKATGEGERAHGG
ncbi:MAG TPA: tetraacyldisaccharide 4'-kinase [Thermoanaerobaculia bacterium]